MQDVAEAVKLVQDAEVQEKDMKHLAQVGRLAMCWPSTLLNKSLDPENDTDEPQRPMEVIPKENYR